ncbi:Hypothetical predicted protein [Pelobates cultripes]|uniref:Uncharacterized protein n=1 Tax=Pelobates cultripes TaxID=61616 RepID=A0AAD1S301_PELCU|nr:Hypothetical predicted protein [Pelobates cultripes]
MASPQTTGRRKPLMCTGTGERRSRLRDREFRGPHGTRLRGLRPARVNRGADGRRPAGKPDRRAKTLETRAPEEVSPVCKMAASKPNYTLHLRAALRMEAFAPDSGQHWRAPPSHLTPGLDLASTTAFLGLEPLRALLIPKPNTWTHHTYQSSRYRPAMEPEPWAQMVGSCGARGPATWYMPDPPSLTLHPGRRRGNHRPRRLSMPDSLLPPAGRTRGT